MALDRATANINAICVFFFPSCLVKMTQKNAPELGALVFFFYFPLNLHIPFKIGELSGVIRANRKTLISEPRFSTPCEMRFFPREKGKKRAFVEGSFSL